MTTKTIQIAKISARGAVYTVHKKDGFYGVLDVIVKKQSYEFNEDGHPTLRKRIVYKTSGINSVSNALMWVAVQVRM